MKKLIVPLVIVLVLVLIGGFVFANKKNKDTDSSSNSTQSSTETVASIDVCQLITLEDAKKLYGPGAKASTATPTPTPTGDNSVKVSMCGYENGKEDIKEFDNFNILVRSSSIGDNKQAYNVARPANAQDISGYGENAYWNPDMGQLNIVKGAHWMIITGSSKPSKDQKPDFAKSIADIVVPKL